MSNFNNSIIFGTARLHHIWNNEKFDSVIKESINLGIKKFDVAPLYGGRTTQRRLRRAIDLENVKINTKVGISTIDLLFEDSLFEYWLRYLFFRLVGKRFQTQKNLRKFSMCLENSFSVFKSVASIDTLFIHEPPILENKNDELLIIKMLHIIDKYKKKNFFRNVGLAGENVFLYKKLICSKKIDYIQTSAINLMKSKDKDIIICLQNLKGLNLYGIHYVNNFDLKQKMYRLLNKLESFPNFSLLISSTSPKPLRQRVKEATDIIQI